MEQRVAVICVDDERMVLQSLREQLRRSLGADIVLEAADSGEDGLDLFDELRTDGTAVAMVISDQLMPGMRGEHFLAAVHSRDPRVLNVLLTGQANADAVGAAVNRAKLYRYIAKPWSEDDLVLTVREAVRSYRQARALELQEEEARRAHAASLRFVPKEFLSLLGRERLVDVRFGDHVEREMHVFFSDMRGYTALVEGKSKADAFAFVNQYIQQIDGAIRAHGGFIGNIEGDAVLGLFSGSADDAVGAAISAQRSLARLNEARARVGERPVQTGMAVHSGPLLLGTVGGEERLQCDVVGDAVNAASRIESMTKLYGARLLISGVTRERLRNGLSMRMVDCVHAKGKQLPVTLFEVLDAQPADVRSAREATRGDFEAALAAYQAGRVEAALNGFRAVSARDPGDGAAALFVHRLERFARDGLPPGWSGVTQLEHK